MAAQKFIVKIALYLNYQVARVTSACRMEASAYGFS